MNAPCLAVPDDVPDVVNKAYTRAGLGPQSGYGPGAGLYVGDVGGRLGSEGMGSLRLGLEMGWEIPILWRAHDWRVG
ncbi:MAG: hypothetical protein MUF74_04270 [Cypionkella sp.]|nr:hypothetical protein [Cypionkella sp.]